jgi:uncharacterized membrane protein YbhN (UPF0104 family)
MACIPSFAGSWLVGFFSVITPAGLGAREGAMWLMLKATFGHTDAAVMAIASRLMMIVIELVSVGLASAFLMQPNRVKSKPEEVSDSVVAVQANQRAFVGIVATADVDPAQ